MISRIWKIKLKVFWIKLLNWEYWSRNIVYTLPFFPYVYCSIKARSFFFFSATNPAIFIGGMFGESKYDLYQLFPTSLQPDTVLIKEGENITELENFISSKNLHFPLIAKPDQGGMGWEVEKIENVSELQKYWVEHPIDIIIQEFIELEEEYSLFYYKIPGELKGNITSITKKTPLIIVGNGKQTLEQLVYENQRSIVLYYDFKARFESVWNEIVPENHKIIINAIGNHARGSIFINQTAKTNSADLKKLEVLIDNIVEKSPGIYFGRFDIKTKNFESLVQGKHFKIIEFNGAGAIPTHIFEPNFPFFAGQKQLIKHIHIMFKIANKLHKSHGVKYISWNEYKKYFKLSNQYAQKVKKTCI
ncbi:MAG: hypothetical protein ORN85_04970 [Sediminibacterium sp.]|nr:hypothetical protein [Sediminibacterium sp.]